MKTLMKYSALLLLSIIYLGAEAQHVSSDRRNIHSSDITKMKIHSAKKAEKIDSKSDSKADAENGSHERIAYDAYGNAIWIPNAADGYTTGYSNGSTSGYSSCNASPNYYNGNGNAYNNGQGYGYANSYINSYGNTGWYNPFPTSQGYGYASGGFNEFDTNYFNAQDWNVTTGDYGLQIPKVGLWLGEIYGQSYDAGRIRGEALYMHEDGFFYRGWRAQDDPYHIGKIQVVLPPRGSSVSHLPRTARKVHHRGQEFYVANNIVFQRRSHRKYKVVGVLG